MKGIGCGWTFGIWATWLRFTPSLAFLFVFCVVTRYHGFIRHALDQVTHADAFDVGGIEHGHRLLFRQLNVGVEDQRFIHDFERVAILAGNA